MPDNPFRKPIGDLVGSDLVCLLQIAEGWYYEYKRQILKPLAIAKSVSAFANSYGGWLFFGIQSDSSSRVAQHFPGIDEAEIGEAETYVRQAVSSLLSPTPYFEHKVIVGPVPEIGLASGKVVLAVYVPQGNDAPYVHASGRIYRRVGDESSPKEETDRHLLDQLWRRSNALKDSIRSTISQLPFRGAGEEAKPTLKLLVFHDPWEDGAGRCNFGWQDFKTIMRDGVIPFRTVFPASGGYVALQTQENNPNRMLFYWRHHFGCTDEVMIPLNIFRLGEVDTIRHFSRYDYGAEFLRECVSSGFDSCAIVDLSLVFSLLHSVAVRLEEVFSKEGVTRKIKFKLQLSGMRRLVPFLDTANFLAAVREDGIPIIQDELMYAPCGVEIDTLGRLDNLRSSEDDKPKEAPLFAMLNAMYLFLAFARSVGLSEEAIGLPFQESPSSDGVWDWYSTLQKAADRARNTTSLTVKRQRRTFVSQLEG